VRSITARGLYFTPSNMVGKGRSFELKGFLKKLREIEGYTITSLYVHIALIS
jgi:hypothetical protein